MCTIICLHQWECDQRGWYYFCLSVYMLYNIWPHTLNTFSTQATLLKHLYHKKVICHKTKHNCEHYVFHDVTHPKWTGAILETDLKIGSTPARANVSRKERSKNLARFLGALLCWTMDMPWMCPHVKLELCLEHRANFGSMPFLKPRTVWQETQLQRTGVHTADHSATVTTSFPSAISVIMPPPP